MLKEKLPIANQRLWDGIQLEERIIQRKIQQEQKLSKFVMTDDHGKAQKHFDLIELDKHIENEHSKG